MKLNTLFLTIALTMTASLQAMDEETADRLKLEKETTNRLTLAARRLQGLEAQQKKEALLEEEKQQQKTTDNPPVVNQEEKPQEPTDNPLVANDEKKPTNDWSCWFLCSCYDNSAKLSISQTK